MYQLAKLLAALETSISWHYCSLGWWLVDIQLIDSRLGLLIEGYVSNVHAYFRHMNVVKIKSQVVIFFNS
jgi:hypothetical protein